MFSGIWFNVTIAFFLSVYITATAFAKPLPSVLLDSRSLSIPFTLASTGELWLQHRIYVVNVVICGASFEVVLDTGSSDLWVDTSDTFTTDGSSLIETGVPVLLEYGVKDIYTYANGTVQYTDVLLPSSQQGSIQPTITLRNQSFVNVPGTTNITQFGNKGILGLGPPKGWSALRASLSGTSWPADPLMTTLFNANPELGKFYTVMFSQRDEVGVVHEGLITIGDVVPALSAIVDAPKLPLTTSRFWDVRSQGFIVDGEVLNLGSERELTFVLDSGVYGLFVPPEYATAMYASIPGTAALEDGSWTVPCDAVFNVSITLGDDVYPIHPIDMTEVYDVENSLPVCRGLVQSNTDARLPFLIGLNVMRNMYVLHHYVGASGGTPYMQAISTLDVDKAFDEFGTMNAARIEAFLASRNHDQATSMSSPSLTSLTLVESVATVSPRVLSKSGRPRERTTRPSWYVQGVLISSACLVVLYSTCRRMCFRRLLNDHPFL